MIVGTLAGMTSPRHQIVSTDSPAFYHCVSRCVRRAFLCGEDAYSGRNFDHRKRWIERRIHQLAESWAISVFAYAVMSNHLHLVVRLEPNKPSEWSDVEVARRWLMIFPGSRQLAGNPALRETQADALSQDCRRINELRARLGSLSWFMRALSEPVARQANREDECTGRFWEGRFRCQLLLDERSVLACMTYVDLNPLRAGLTSGSEYARYTSARWRIKANHGAQRITQSAPDKADQPLAAVSGLPAEKALEITERAYLDLVRATAKAFLKPAGKTTGGGLGTRPAHQTLPGWINQVTSIECRYFRAVGSILGLTTLAQRLGQRWMQGIGWARQLALTGEFTIAA